MYLVDSREGKELRLSCEYNEFHMENKIELYISFSFFEYWISSRSRLVGCMKIMLNRVN